MTEIDNIKPVILARNLKKSFGSFTAVDNISFEVDKGVCFGILGPNGAGKTSTVKMIYGFSPITSGDIFVFGLDIKNNTEKSRPALAYASRTIPLTPI